MRGYLKSFLLFFTLCCTGSAWSDTVGAGALCGGTTGNSCAENLYCSAVGKCSECPSGYPYSDGNATSNELCYTNCPDENIVENGINLGTKTDGKKYNTTDAQCEYTKLVCNSQAKEDTTNNTCTGKCFPITLKTNSTVDPNDKELYFKYADGLYKNDICTIEYTNGSFSSIVPEQEYGSEWYKTFMGYYSSETGGTQYFDASGTPNIGYTTFTSATILYGHWQENNCTIKYKIDGTQYGAPQTCHYSRAGQTALADYKCTAASNPNKSKEGKEVISWDSYAFGAEIPCDATHTETTLNAVWGPCSAGYYCTADNGRKACPAGATSATGASVQTQCYISSATQFRDKNGTFNLPIGTNVIYYQ